MAFVTDDYSRDDSVVTDPETRAIETLIRTKLEVWIKERGTAPFEVKDLLADVDPNWNGTPLIALTDHYRLSRDEAEARKEAGKALGRIVKSMLRDDARLFDSSRGFRSRKYWLVR